MSDQFSLQPPSANPRKRKSGDNLHSQMTKAPLMGLLNPMQAAPAQGESVSEDSHADDVLSIVNMAKTAVDTKSIFEPSLFFTRDATIAALKAIVRCWAPGSGLIPEEDLNRWYETLLGDEIMALSILAWNFGTDETGLRQLCSFMSLLPENADGLKDIWTRNRFRQGWNFETPTDFKSVLHTVKGNIKQKAFEHPAFAEIAAQSREVQKVIESDLQEWLYAFQDDVAKVALDQLKRYKEELDIGLASRASQARKRTVSPVPKARRSSWLKKQQQCLK
ncbi:hypothetical protein ACJ73_09565 [Blastomyces percursus]|uniref:Uncharacterized protein n=1 Tax=Blastomyces percursus TaxID=1658174 RepID=A0A1J9Q5W8_9EURO|nr:hypothetical protein ACJ73_09565 [Blastomyces percursus]